MELPYVLECGVSAAPDEVRGQVVKASIVLVKGTQGTEELKIKPVSLKINPDIADDRFKEIVGTIKEHIKSGDAFQVVPSRTLSPTPNIWR